MENLLVSVGNERNLGPPDQSSCKACNNAGSELLRRLEVCPGGGKLFLARAVASAAVHHASARTNIQKSAAHCSTPPCPAPPCPCLRRVARSVGRSRTQFEYAINMQIAETLKKLRRVGRGWWGEWGRAGACLSVLTRLYPRGAGSRRPAGRPAGRVWPQLR